MIIELIFLANILNFHFLEKSQDVLWIYYVLGMIPPTTQPGNVSHP